MSSENRLDVDKPLWDVSTFMGRLRHFAWITDPRICMVPDKQLDEAKELIDKYRLGQEPPGTTQEKIIYAKKLYESAFHPDTKEKQNLFGRMSFQVPGNMVITGAMLQFYRTTTAVIFWQWANQSFNALVNYTNRNANSPLTTTQLSIAYVSATASAVVTALGCKKVLANTQPIFQRFVPYLAVAAANCVNIPLMRQNEIQNGIELVDENGNSVKAKSKIGAVKGISQVIISRIVMCTPGMVVLPVIMEKLETYNWMKRIKVLHGPIQVVFVGFFLTFMTPIGCALFPQNCRIRVSTLERYEPKEYSKVVKYYEDKELPKYLYFNKGL